MIIWVWDDRDRIWEARELPAGASAMLGGMAVVICRRAGLGILLSRPGVFVNGLPALPLRVLAHHDEIRAFDRTYVFSAEALAEPAPFPEPRSGAACARCGGPLSAGEPAIICGCDSPYHPECFTFDPRCASCPMPTGGVLSVPGGAP